jgi:hypothetical protein
VKGETHTYENWEGAPISVECSGAHCSYCQAHKKMGQETRCKNCKQLEAVVDRIKTEEADRRADFELYRSLALRRGKLLVKIYKMLHLDGAVREDVFK